jgi:glycosyltransferase involved in cell wall biosynthesis
LFVFIFAVLEEQRFRKDRVKILHVLASSLGGGASHVFDLITHGATGIEQRLAVSPDGGNLRERLRAIGTEVDEVDMAKGWKWSALATLIRVMRKYQPDIVHCHGFRAGLYGRIAAKLASRKMITILTVHGFHYFYYRNRLKKKALMLLERLMRPLTDCVIAVSKTDWQHLVGCKVVSKKKSRLIINGIPAFATKGLGRDEIRTRLGLRDAYPIIATVARLHVQKGVIYFLEAIPFLLKFFPSATFLVIGDGPERAGLERTARDLNILHSLRFLGNRDDINDLLSIVDVFVLASLWEGLPLSLLEAMRAGVPIVATDVDGNRDAIENGVSGLLVAPMNSEQLAKAVMQILSSPDLMNSLIKNGNIRFNAGFSLINMLEKTRQTYMELYEFSQEC